MASFAPHLAASLFLCPLGFCRIFCSTLLYLKNPSLYRSRIWYVSESNWKNLDLYALLILLPIASLFNLSIIPLSSDSPTYRFSFLHQSIVIAFFWITLILIFLKEIWHVHVVPDNFVFIFASIAFAIDFYGSGKGVGGIGAAAYANLGVLTALSGVACVYLSFRPSAYFAEFFLSSGLVLKGTWVLQVGLSLYTDAYGLKGCDKITGVPLSNGIIDVKCELEDDMWRGLILMNLLFVGHFIVVVFGGVVFFGLLHRFRNPRGGVLLAETESEIEMQ